MRWTTQSGSRLRGITLLLTLAPLLGGCLTTGSRSDCKLLPLVEYDHERSAAIVRQIQASPAELQRFALDAVELRDAVRACRW